MRLLQRSDNQPLSDCVSSDMPGTRDNHYGFGVLELLLIRVSND